MQTISAKEVSKLNWAPVASYNKYHNRKKEYNGVLYHSTKEADFAATLDQCMHAKNKEERVLEWKGQVPFKMVVKKKHICTYFCDFVVKYFSGRTEYIDVKGGEATKTDVYVIKKKLMKAIHGIDIKEV